MAAWEEALTVVLVSLEAVVLDWTGAATEFEVAPVVALDGVAIGP